MNPTRPLSPFLKMLVDGKSLSPKLAERINQLSSIELQKQAVAALPGVLLKKAEELCYRLEHPEAATRVLYTDPAAAPVKPAFWENLQRTSAQDAPESRTPLFDWYDSVLRKHFNRFRGHRVFQGVLIFLYLWFLWGGLTQVFSVVTAPLKWSWHLARLAAER